MGGSAAGVGAGSGVAVADGAMDGAGSGLDVGAGAVGGALHPAANSTISKLKTSPTRFPRARILAGHDTRAGMAFGGRRMSVATAKTAMIATAIHAGMDTAGTTACFTPMPAMAHTSTSK